MKRIVGLNRRAHGLHEETVFDFYGIALVAAAFALSTALVLIAG